MTQTPTSKVSGDDWRALSTWPEAERPPAPWSWLGHTGSMTSKLRQLAGDAFHVQILNETGIVISADDARLLGLPDGSTVQMREVYLCGTEPLVFGRTLAPDSESARWLEDLGRQPLGDRVFADHSAMRSEIEVKQVTAADDFYHDAMRSLSAPPASVWARRSVLSVRATRLLIYEAFLPGVSA